MKGTWKKGSKTGATVPVFPARGTDNPVIPVGTTDENYKARASEKHPRLVPGQSIA